MRQYLSLPLLALTGILLTSCGGGGGGGTTGPSTSIPPPAPAPEPPAPVIDYDTAEYRRNYGLASVNSIPAYEAGLSGEGVTVGVVDTGIDLLHEDLDANISPLSIDLDSGTYGGVQDEHGHGTWVAGIIAAEKNDTGTHGVAFNAEIMAIRADDHTGCDDGCNFNSNDVAAGVNHAVANGAKVINLSLGGGFSISPLSQLGTALINAVDQGVVVVIAAGNGVENADGVNEGQPEPDAFAAFAAQPSVKGGIIIAGAVDQFNDMAEFSNRAGAAGGTQDVYMVAPGVSIRTTALSSTTTTIWGTSVAAPHIAAAAAILLEMFPNLTGREAVQILLDTARDLGPTGDDTTFGQGLVDIAAAIQPIGTLSLSGASDESMALEGELLSSPAMGAGLSAAVNGALAFDTYNRAYKADLATRFQFPASRFNLTQAAERMNRVSSSLTLDNRDTGGRSVQLSVSVPDTQRQHAATSLEMQARDGDERPDLSFQASLTPRLSFSMQSGSTAGRTAATGELALTARGVDPASQLSASGQRAGLTFSLAPGLEIGTAAFTGERDDADRLDRSREAPSQSGAALILRQWMGRSAHLDMEAGRMTETGSTLGLTGTGVFDGIDGASTDYLKLGGGLAVGALRLDGSYMVGRTNTDINNSSVFTGFSTLKSDGWAVTLTETSLAAEGHLFGLHVTQPLAVTSGTATLRLATGWQDDAPVYSDRSADLSVTQRETSFELFHRFRASDSMSLQSNFIYRRNPDNLVGTGDEAAIFLHLATAL